MSKVLVADGFNVLNINYFAQSARINYILDSAVVWRVAEDCVSC